MSGEPGVGRTCLRPGEIDPQGVAQLCVTPSVQPIPRVGIGGWEIIIALAGGVIVGCICYLIDRG